MIETATRLSAQQPQFYEKKGYLFPVRIFDNAETANFCRHFDEYTRQNEERLKELIPRERRETRSMPFAKRARWILTMQRHTSNWPAHTAKWGLRTRP